jgi:hypothetical protein
MPRFLDPLLDSLRTTWAQVVEFSPEVIGAFLFLVLGWLLAQLARRLVIRLLRLMRIDVAAERGGVEDFLLRGGVRYTAVTLMGQLVYWSVLLVSVLAVFNLLGLPMSSTLFVNATTPQLIRNFNGQILIKVKAKGVRCQPVSP